MIDLAVAMSSLTASDRIAVAVLRSLRNVLLIDVSSRCLHSCVQPRVCSAPLASIDQNYSRAACENAAPIISLIPLPVVSNVIFPPLSPMPLKIELASKHFKLSRRGDFGTHYCVTDENLSDIFWHSLGWRRVSEDSHHDRHTHTILKSNYGAS